MRLRRAREDLMAYLREWQYGSPTPARRAELDRLIRAARSMIETLTPPRPAPAPAKPKRRRRAARTKTWDHARAAAGEREDR